VEFVSAARATVCRKTVGLWLASQRQTMTPIGTREAVPVLAEPAVEHRVERAVSLRDPKLVAIELPGGGQRLGRGWRDLRREGARLGFVADDLGAVDLDIAQSRVGALRFTIVISAGHPHPVPICGSSTGQRRLDLDAASTLDTCHQ
jgi:hypothetical protein